MAEEELEAIDLSEYQPDYSGAPLPASPYGRRSMTGRFPIYAPTGRNASIVAPAQPAISPEDQAIIDKLPDRRAPMVPPDPQDAPIVTANRNKIERSLSLAATLNIPFADAYDNEESLSASLEAHDKNWFKTAGTSFMRGVGGLYQTAGQAMEWMGLDATEQKEFGQRIQRAYMPTHKPQEFTWSRMIDPEWWATTGAESLPSALALIPASVIGAYAGSAGAAAAGLGAFGSAILTGLGGATVATLGESALEAGQAYGSALEKGRNANEAKKIADDVFKANLVAVGGTDLASIALAFTPIRLFGGTVNKTLARRVIASTGKYAAVAGSEGAQEGAQDVIQRWAAGEPIKLDPQMKESIAAGMVFGLGLNGAGSVWDGLTRRVESKMPGPVAEKYQESIAARAMAGQDIETAKREALDEFTLSHEGSQIVKDTIAELKDIAEGKTPPPKTQEEMNQAIDTMPDAETFEPADLPQADIDQMMAEHFEPIARGEMSVEELMGEEPQPEEMAERQKLADRPNILVSEESFEAAKKSLRERASGFHAEIFDPRALVDAIKIGSYYAERGIRNFADWAKLMVETAGNWIEPHLPAIWSTVEKDRARTEAGVKAGQEMLAGKAGRTPRQAVFQAIEEHVKTLTASPVELTYRGELFQKAVKEKRGVRLIGDRELFVTGNKIMEIEESIPFDVSGEEITAKPLSAAAKQFKAMAQEMEKAKMPARDVKRQVRLTTGQEQVVKLIREDVALRAAMKKAEQASRIAFREGSKEGVMAARADMEDILLKAKVVARWKGYKEGYIFSERVNGDEMKRLFREKEKHSQDTREALVDLVQESLPPELRGKFLDAVVAKVTEKKVNETLDRIEAAGNKATKDELIAELSTLKERRGSIDVEYKKRIDALLGDINTRKITPATREKVEGILRLAEENGMASGLTARDQLTLRRLEMRQADDMTNEELKELRDLAEHLTALGKAKQKLKNKYDKEERETNRAALLASTQNMDPTVTGKDTRADRWKQGSIDLYLELLNPLRVFEMMDAYRKGQNYKYGARIGRAETDAQWNANKEKLEALEEIQALGITDAAEIEARNDEIMANIRAMEGAETAAKKIMEKNGWTELPELTEKEKGLIEVLRKYSNRKQAEVAAYYEERTNEPFIKLDTRILPLKYEGEFNLAPDEVMLHTPHRATQAEHGFTIERKQNVQKIPRTDVMGIFEQGINEREWWLAVQPELDNISELVQSKEYVEKAGAVNANYWRDHIDIVARRGWDSKARHTALSKGLREIRGNISKGVLGWRLSSMLMQPAAVFDALAYTSSEWGPSTAAQVFGEFSKTWLSPEHFRQIKEGSKAVQMRTGAGELSVDELLATANGGSFKDKFLRNGLKLLQAGDVRTAAGMKSAVQKILENRGVPNPAAEAETIMQLVSSSSDVAMRPHTLARGEMARTWFTFQTFMLNRFGIIAHDLINKGVIHGEGSKQKLTAMVGLGIMIAGKLAEDEAREFVYETIKRRELPDKKIPLWVKAMFSLPSSIPTLGNIFELASSRGGSSEMPLIKLINDIGRGLTAPFKQTEKSKPETMWKALLAGIEAGTIIIGGQPGTSQFFDILEGQLFPEQKGRGQAAAALR